MSWLRLVLAAWVLLAGSLPAYAAAANRDLQHIPSNLIFLFVVAVVLVVMGDKVMLMGSDRRLRAARRKKFIFGTPLCWLVLSLVHAETGWFASNWIALPLWLGLVLLMFAFGQHLVPGPLRRWFASIYPDDTPSGYPRQEARCLRLGVAISPARATGWTHWIPTHPMWSAAPPAWRSFLANTSQQFFARRISTPPAICRARSVSKPSATRRRTSPNRAAPGRSPAARPAVPGSICRAVR